MSQMQVSKGLGSLLRAGDVSHTAMIDLDRTEFDANQFLTDIQQDWGISLVAPTADECKEKATLIGTIDSIKVAVQANAPSDTGSDAALTKTTQIRLDVWGAQRTILKISRWFVRIVASLVKQDALAIHGIGSTKNPDVYRKMAFQYETDNEFPLFNIIGIHLYSNDQKTLCAYTTGMEKFGKMNLEVFQSTESPNHIRQFLADVAHYMITSNIGLLDHETIGFAGEDKHSISISDGIAVQGSSIKINYYKNYISQIVH